MPLSTERICELVKRRLKDAGLPSRLSPHSFRVTAITSLLEQGVPMEDVQYLAGHAEPRTTTLYDRRKKKVTRNIRRADSESAPAIRANTVEIGASHSLLLLWVYSRPQQQGGSDSHATRTLHAAAR